VEDEPEREPAPASEDGSTRVRGPETGAPGAGGPETGGSEAGGAVEHSGEATASGETQAGAHSTSAGKPTTNGHGAHRGPGESAAADGGRGELLPVLWSEASPQAELLEAVPHWPVAAGRLHLALAVVAPTPRGTIGMYHVTHHQLGEFSFDVLMAEACENLAARLRVDSRYTDDGQLLTVSGTLVAAAVCLPDFYWRLSELSGSDQLIVGLPGPDEVYVAAAGSPLEDVVRRLVRESEYPAIELVPSVLSIAGDRIEVLEEVTR
jgi:hypothetical protein